MSKVELSLREYDELKEELDILREIVEAMTTPRIDNWSVNWYNEKNSSTLSITTDSVYESLSKKAAEFLKRSIRDNVTYSIFDELNLEGEVNYSSFSINLGYLERKEEVGSGD